MSFCGPCVHINGACTILQPLRGMFAESALGCLARGKGLVRIWLCVNNNECEMAVQSNDLTPKDTSIVRC